MAGSYLRIPSSSGHNAAGSALASPLWTATWTIFGVNRSASTPATSSRAASDSPSRSRSQARSATQSTGWTLAGAWTRASRALRSAICAQREAIGVAIRRISVDRNGPLARPQGSSPSPALRGSRAPTVQGSRRAQPGYSTGGAGGPNVVAGFDTSSTAVSSAPPSGKAEGEASCWTGAPELDVAGAGETGRGAVCWASAGRASTSTADAIRSGLVRIASLRDGGFDCVSRLLLGQRREEIDHADQQDGDDDEHWQSRHATACAERASHCIAP